MKRIDQQFLTGLNERIPADRDTGNRFQKLKNAKLFIDGETGYVSRMSGFARLWNDKWQEYTNPITHLVVQGDHDTSNYTKGYRIKLEDIIYVEDENSLGFDFTQRMMLWDDFKFRTIPIPKLKDTFSLQDRLRYKVIRLVVIRDTFTINDQTTLGRTFKRILTDSLTGPTDDTSVIQVNTILLQFNHSFGVEDTTTEKAIRIIRLVDTVELKDANLECLE
jgi:hypothetical protein